MSRSSTAKVVCVELGKGKRPPKARDHRGWFRVRTASGGIAFRQAYSRHRNARRAARDYARKHRVKLVEVS